MFGSYDKLLVLFLVCKLKASAKWINLNVNVDMRAFRKEAVLVFIIFVLVHVQLLIDFGLFILFIYYFIVLCCVVCGVVWFGLF